MSTEKIALTTDIRTDRADQLQFLRFLAFGLIFLWHADAWSFKFFPMRNGAANGVVFFVILSGVVSGYSSFNKNINCSAKSVTLYVYKKIKKIYPLYFITTLFTVSYSGLALYIANQNFYEAKKLFIQLLKNLFLIQSWYPKNYFLYNGVGWFLSTLFFLYIISRPLLYLAEKIRKLKYAIGYFFIILGCVGAVTVIYCYLMRNTNMVFWEYVFPPSRMGEYIIGICVANIVRLVADKIKDTHIVSIIFTFLEIAVMLFWLYSMYCTIEVWQFRIVFWLLPNILLLSVFSFGRGALSRLFKLRFLKYLGDISFECFLIHQIVIHEYSLNSGVGAISTIGNLFSITFCLLITVLMAGLIHKKTNHKTQ